MRTDPLTEYRNLRKYLLDIWEVHPSRIRGKSLHELKVYYNEVVDDYLNRDLKKHMKEEVTNGGGV